MLRERNVCAFKNLRENGIPKERINEPSSRHDRRLICTKRACAGVLKQRRRNSVRVLRGAVFAINGGSRRCSPRRWRTWKSTPYTPYTPYTLSSRERRDFFSRRTSAAGAELDPGPRAPGRNETDIFRDGHRRSLARAARPGGRTGFTVA